MAENTLPSFESRLAYILLSVVLILGLIYYAQEIIVPIMLALLFAVLLRPVAGFLRKRLRLPHVLSSMTAVFLMIIIVLGIFVFISWQITGIADDWGKIKHNVNIHISNLQQLIHDHFNLSRREQVKMLNDATKDSMTTGKEIVGTTLLSFSDMLLNLVLIPIYTFLFLLYRTHFMKFLSKLVPMKYQLVLEDILATIKISVQSYIVGLMIEMIIVSVLTSIGFMIIGLQYAILLGIITGILNLIPYIGITIAGMLAIIASLTTNTDFSMIFGVIIVNVVVQLIDNNLLVPMIVSSKVEINAFVSIAGIIVGGAIAGISGMFLAIPFIAILKVIFDRIQPLEPWGYLLGDDLPRTYEWHRIRLPFYDYDTSVTIKPAPKPAPEMYTETSTGRENK
jgi:predicted PurR-regulated permease PerM